MKRRVPATIVTVLLAITTAVAVPTAARSAPAAVPGAELVHSTVFPDATEPSLADVRVRLAAGSAAYRVTLQRGDRVLDTQRAAATGGVVVLEAETLTDGQYTVTVTQGARSTALRVSIRRGWAPIDADQPSWQRCRTITWSYDARRAPNGGDRYMVRDVTAVLTQLSTATGLRFRRVATDGDMIYAWGNTGAADGVGGLEWTDGPGTVVRGTVTLSLSSTWAKKPGQTERQVLLLHETAHAIGLGHVTNARSLMSPTYRPGVTRATLGSGEVRALRTIYRPSTCE